MFNFLLNIALCSAAHHGQNIALQASDITRHSSLVRKLEFKHRLRVCNAYPTKAPVDVYRAKEKLTDSPMVYKQCHEFKIQLFQGDKLIFKINEQSVGTFAVGSMPDNDAILVLVISRHDTLSTAVSFESHIFANLLNAQLAVIDTFKGKSNTNVKIRDASDSESKRSEELRYDSVVAINPGKYNIVLADAQNKERSSRELIAVNREAYVALRIGLNNEKGSAFPEEILVFPHSDELLLSSSSAPSIMILLAILAFW